MEGIRVTVEEKGPSVQKQYPYYGIGENGTLVLFDRPLGGIVIKKGTGWLGDGKLYASNWDESGFEIFHGKITIEVE